MPYFISRFANTSSSSLELFEKNGTMCLLVRKSLNSRRLQVKRMNTWGHMWKYFFFVLQILIPETWSFLYVEWSKYFLKAIHLSNLETVKTLEGMKPIWKLTIGENAGSGEKYSQWIRPFSTTNQWSPVEKIHQKICRINLSIKIFLFIILEWLYDFINDSEWKMNTLSMWYWW